MATTTDFRNPGRVAFTYPDFLRYQIARFCIVTALEMLSVAVGWQVYDITHRALDLGLVGLAQFLPGFFLFSDLRPRCRPVQPPPIAHSLLRGFCGVLGIAVGGFLASSGIGLSNLSCVGVVGNCSFFQWTSLAVPAAAIGARATLP